MVLEKRINSVENRTQLLLTTYGLDVLGVIVILAPAGSSPVGGLGPPCGGGSGQLDGRDSEAVDSFDPSLFRHHRHRRRGAQPV